MKVTKCSAGHANWLRIPVYGPPQKLSPTANQRDLMNRDALAGYNCERLC
jgi:hypothetical protein